jgi:methylenetetrahydrofolate reductase (NADPH)
MTTASSPHRWSLEVIPAHADQVSVFRGLVDEIFVTMIPGSEPGAVLAAVETIAGLGFTAVPHLAAREFKSAAQLAEFFDGIRRIGIRKALLLAGGTSHPPGPFAHTLDLLRSDGFARAGLQEVAVAGHPEGNPSDPDSRRSLEQKLEFLHAAKLKVEIVTQWSFSPENVSEYIASLRAAGISETVAVGVAGPAALKTLLKFAQICGVSAATDVLAKQGFSFARLLMSNKPEAFVAGVKGTNRFHLYPFGGLEKCARWLEDQKVATTGAGLTE